MSDNDELVSQFLAFTGSADTARAISYLEMSGGNLETAVGLYMEHQTGGGVGASAMGGGGGGPGGGTAGAGGMGSPDVRAPDATRTMRLMDDGIGGLHGGYMHVDSMIDEHFTRSAFAAGPAYFRDAREVVNAAAAAAAESENDASNTNGVDEAKRSAYDDDDDDAEEDEEEENENETKRSSRNSAATAAASTPKHNLSRLADMFAPPDHLIYKEGGFEGARTMAKDSKRWLLVNLQRDSEFSCHALNRDVWRNDLVENLIREGFIFWQAMDISTEGQVYSQRYHVYDYPHIGIIDPRTRRLMWKKEGWTQEKPMTAELFTQTAMDFCSRHSFDKPPVAPRPPNGANSTARPSKRPMHEMSEDEQLQAAMRASLESPGDNPNGDDNDDDDEIVIEDDEDVEFLGTSDDMKPEAVVQKELSFMDKLLAAPVGDEPSSGARIQIRMPDGKRTVRKFVPSEAVQTIYAFIAQSNEECKSNGREFVLMAGFPPKDLISSIDSSIESCQLAGQAITVRWK